MLRPSPAARGLLGGEMDEDPHMDLKFWLLMCLCVGALFLIGA